MGYEHIPATAEDDYNNNGMRLIPLVLLSKMDIIPVPEGDRGVN